MMPDTRMPDFIVIDDERINNIICQKVIQAALPGATVQTFTDPEKGLGYILSSYAEDDAHNAVLFVDLNMPTVTGWQVLGRFEKFPEKVRAHVTVYILSSSVNSSDKMRAAENPVVTGFISKPLSEQALRKVCPGLFEG